jgi:hypothetical protein
MILRSCQTGKRKFENAGRRLKMLPNASVALQDGQEGGFRALDDKMLG